MVMAARVITPTGPRYPMVDFQPVRLVDGKQGQLPRPVDPEQPGAEPTLDASVPVAFDPRSASLGPVMVLLVERQAAGRTPAALATDQTLAASRADPRQMVVGQQGTTGRRYQRAPPRQPDGHQPPITSPMSSPIKNKLMAATPNQTMASIPLTPCS